MVATVIVVVATPLPVFVSVGVLVWAFWASRRVRLNHFSARCVMLGRERAIDWRDAAGQWHSGKVEDGSFVAPWLTIIRWRPEGAWFDRTILVLPDMIEGETFRHLRVLLRHA